MKKNEARMYTNMVLNLVDQGILKPLAVAKSALGYMSESEVQDLAESEGWIEEEEDEEEEDEEEEDEEEEATEEED